MSDNLIFLHLPKNGGNTLHFILERFYRRENTFTIRVINNTHLNTNEFISLPEEQRAKIRLLKGHMEFGLHEYLEGESKYITFVRNPEERIVSYYRYVKNRPEHRLYKMVKKDNLTLAQFAARVNEPDVHNAQIRFISGIDADEDTMYQKALENIDKHFAFVGLTHRYHESLILLKQIYGWPLPFYIHKNKARNQVIKRRADKEAQAVISDRNKGDLRLFREMSSRFNALIPDTDRSFESDLNKLERAQQFLSSPLVLNLYSLGKDSFIAKQVKSLIHK